MIKGKHKINIQGPKTSSVSYKNRIIIDLIQYKRCPLGLSYRPICLGYAHNLETGPSSSESLSLSEEDVMDRESFRIYSTT